MDLELEKKVAIVLSSSQGLGYGIAETLAKEGCSIALCSRNDKKIESASAKISSDYGVEVFSRAIDVADETALTSFMRSVVEHFGKLDILVANSGGPPPGTCMSLSSADYELAFKLVFMSKVIAAKLACVEMQKNQSGRIIFIESTSVKQSMHNMVLSNSMRSASAAYAKTLSMEVGNQGIRVHTLLVGPFNTNRVRELGKKAAENQQISFDEWLKNAEGTTPLKRFGDPLELGNLVAFLSSQKSSYMNGTTILVDGGITTSNF